MKRDPAGSRSRSIAATTRHSTPRAPPSSPSEKRFVKHSGVRAAVHRDLVKPGLLPEDLGRVYDRLFHDRQQGDYIEFVSFEAEDVGTTIGAARRLVRAFEELTASTG